MTASRDIAASAFSVRCHMASFPPENPAYPNPPEWLQEGARHVWLPYAQMQTVPMTLPAVKTEGVRITLEDGRELIDGVSSW